MTKDDLCEINSRSDPSKSCHPQKQILHNMRNRNYHQHLYLAAKKELRVSAVVELPGWPGLREAEEETLWVSWVSGSEHSTHPGVTARR